MPPHAFGPVVCEYAQTVRRSAFYPSLLSKEGPFMMRWALNGESFSEHSSPHFEMLPVSLTKNPWSLIDNEVGEIRNKVSVTLRSLRGKK